jgi:hypothetical protein
MPTPKPEQDAASGADPLTSTGRSTPIPPATSPFSALKQGADTQHQILFTGSAGDLAALTAEHEQRHSPASSGERFLVDTLIHNEWRRRRLHCVEADLRVVATNVSLGQHPGAVEAGGSGDALVTAAGPLKRLQRVVNSYERNYQRAFKELQDLQACQAQDLPSSQPEQTKPASTFSASFDHFIETASTAAPKPPPPRRLPAPTSPQAMPTGMIRMKTPPDSQSPPN